MRVLRISHSAVVSAWRERESVIRQLGVRVELLSARRWNEGGAGVPLVPEVDEHVIGVRTLGSHPILFLYDPRPIWRHLGERWDVIDIHEEPYALSTAEILLLRWLRRQRAPFVLYSAQNIYKRYPVPFRWLERWALAHAAAVSVCNSDAARIARRKGLLGLAAYIPLGLDTSRYAPAILNDATPRHQFTVGYVGRLESHKGVDVLLEAVAAVPEWRVEIAGGGPGATALHRRADRPDLRGRVRFRGHLGQDDLPGFYRDLDALAVPSRPTPGWLEQFCRVAVEAMASGIPVIASRSGALPEVIDEAGILVPPSDPVALRAALTQLSADPTVVGRLRAAGPMRASQFSWQRVGERYVQLYHTIVARDGLTAVRGGHSVAERPSAQERDHNVDIEVIIVAYGAAAMFQEALKPLIGEFALTVVDNSSDPQIRALTDAAGGRYIDPARNLGFGAGVNVALGARQSTTADVLLLNPDAVIDPEGIRRLHTHLNADAGLASVGPAQVDIHGHPARVEWPFPSPGRALLEAIGLGGVPASDTYVIGSVLLIKSAALESVGPFDERFFLYAEETDWAYRASRAGWTHQVVESVTAVHHGAGTGGDPIVRETMFHSSNEIYLRKHFGSTGWHIARAGVIGGAAVRGVVLPADRRRAARRRLSLYARGPMKTAAALSL